MLSDAEKRRYKRHIILPEIGESGQEKLKTSRVLVIGAGGLGSPALQYLTAAGLGTIAIMDDEVVNEENLNRQILYGGHDLGKLKTIICKQKLNSQNPLVKHEIFNIRLKPDNAIGFVSQYDIIVDATDNLSSGYLINDACILAGKPFVWGGLQKFEGLVSSFNFMNSPSLRCIYPADTIKPGSEIAQNCMFGVLPGIIGSILAAEVIKIITGIGTPLLGKMLKYNMLTNMVDVVPFEKQNKNFVGIKLQDVY